MTPALLALDEETVDGRVARRVSWFADGTVTVEESGEVVESRPQTELEASRFAVQPELSDAERLTVLVDALAKATTLAQVRAAAAKAAESA